MNNIYIPPNLSLRVEIIGPERAKRILGKNRNRRVRKHRVTKIANRIKASKWRLNGETIIIDKDGWLIDGQHRLYAIIEADMPCACVVVYGVEDVEGTIDDCLPRSAADWLDLILKGRINSSELSKAISWCCRYESRAMQSTAAPTFEQQKAYLQHNEDLIESFGKLHEWRVGRIFKAYPLLAALHYQASLVLGTVADEFFRGIGDTKGNDVVSVAAAAMRDWFTTERNRPRKTPSWIVAGILIKALKLHRDGATKITGNNLRLRTGADAEAFPEIR